jgi:pimeloyl-ACP methyl ester carboxylesterase
MIDLVDPSWIIKALGAMFALALVCAYATFCVVYSHTQWQLVLRPSRKVAATPASVGLAFSEVHFGVDATGQPQLDGWWIPSDSAADPTAILLHSGDGSMADALQAAHDLHNARLNVLVFDYEGYGRSSGLHPTEATMEADAETAFRYLTDTRGLAAASLIAYGNGAGASLAVRLCADHPRIAALIVESPSGDFKTQVEADTRSRLMPVSLLFNQNFALADPLHHLVTPKLLISYSAKDGAAPVIFQRAADPKMTVEFSNYPAPAMHETLTRFLGAYVAHPPGVLVPKP